MHLIQIWSPGGATCIATLPWIALLALSASIQLVSSSTHQLSQPNMTHLERLGPIDRTPGIPGSDKNVLKVQINYCIILFFVCKHLPCYFVQPVHLSMQPFFTLGRQSKKQHNCVPLDQCMSYPFSGKSPP